MMGRILIDTGPLVAIFLERDQHHARCVQQFRELPPPLLTTWPNLTEAVHLLKASPNGVNTLFQFLDEGLLSILPLDDNAPVWIEGFMERYQDQRPDLADAALMYLAEQHGIGTVFTLDRRDFTIYRTSDRQPLSLLPE